MYKYVLLLLLPLCAISCNSNNNTQQTAPTLSKTQIKLNQDKSLSKAYFASGCFWCVEAIFESVIGVEEVISGYAGGTTKNPTYEQVSYGRTDHAEAVEVYYDPSVVSFETLVRVFYGSHDPTTLNQQGPDKGAQYRSIAFYNNSKEKKIIETITAELNKSTFNNAIVTEIKKIAVFYEAEAYHQNFEKRNPRQSYVVAVSIPRLNRFKAKFPELIKKEH